MATVSMKMVEIPDALEAGVVVGHVGVLHLSPVHCLLQVWVAI